MKSERGYSLLEALVALIVFAVITLATAFAIQNGMRIQTRVHSSADDTQEARAVLSILTRDLRSAIVSASNPNTFFVATGDRAGQMLTFTTFSQRLWEDASEEDAGPSAGFMPQSDVMAVSYFLDPDTGQLSRSYSSIPNPQLMPEPGSPGTLLSSRIRSVEFQFVDPQTGLRTEWSYVPQTEAGGTGQGSAGTSPSPAQTGDTYLPSAVQITLEMLGRDLRPQRYTCAVSLASPIPMPSGQQPEPTPAGAGQPGGADGGGGAGGDGGGGAGPRSVPREVPPWVRPGLPALPNAGGLLR